MHNMNDFSSKLETKRSSQAVDAKRGSYFLMDPGQLTIVGVDTGDTVANPLWDPRIKLPLDEAMVRNIRVYGVIEPIVAVKDGDQVMVVDGRRRVLHAREAARRQAEAGEEALRVPVIFKKGSDVRLFGVSQAANRFRVNDGPLVSARNAQRMLDLGATIDEVAGSFGVSDQTVRNWLQMLTMAPEVLEATERNELAATTALMLAPLDKYEQVEALHEIRREQASTGKTVTGETVRRRVAAKTGRLTVVLSPKERIEKATAILMKAAAGSQNRDAWLDALNRLTKVLLGKQFSQLAMSEEDE